MITFYDNIQSNQNLSIADLIVLTFKLDNVLNKKQHYLFD